jgi:flagella basal body P-ring formation protein FlgA
MEHGRNPMNIRKRYLLTLVTLFALAAGFADTAMAARHVSPSVVVDGYKVTLGDLFDLADNAQWAQTVVADAPAPGVTDSIRIHTVAAAARRAGMAWDEATAPMTITVTRASQPVSLDSIRDLLTAALPDGAMGRDWEMQLNNPRLAIHLPVNARVADIEVRRIYFDDRSGSFNATLALPLGDGASRDEVISGRLVEVTYVPVLKDSKRAGDIIRQGDLHWQKMEARRVNRNIMTSPDGITGMAARRSLRADTPIRPTDVERPVVVEKGSTVTLIVDTGAMMLTATGRALENGALNDHIRVVNTSTHITVEGVVSSPRQVTINLNSRIAALK